MNKPTPSTKALRDLAESFARNSDYSVYQHYFEEIMRRLDKLDELNARLGAMGGSWAMDIRWSRIVADEKGFSNGRFYYFDKPVEVVRKVEATSTLGPTPETTGEDLDAVREQAAAWREVANYLYDIDPEWHKNGKPMESALKFIHGLRHDAMYAEFFKAVSAASVDVKVRQNTMSPLLGAPYGREALAQWNEKRADFKPATEIRQEISLGKCRRTGEMNYGKAPDVGYIRQIGDAPATLPFGKAPGANADEEL